MSVVAAPKSSTAKRPRVLAVPLTREPALRPLRAARGEQAHRRAAAELNAEGFASGCRGLLRLGFPDVKVDPQQAALEAIGSFGVGAIVVGRHIDARVAPIGVEHHVVYDLGAMAAPRADQRVALRLRGGGCAEYQREERP